jgi:phosphoribosylamine-glycine ligase
MQPLLPWLRETKFSGPLQVTAVRRDDRWQVIEFNVRMGVTCGPMILRLLADPVQVLSDVVRNKNLELKFKQPQAFGCSLTLAGYGYPYTQVKGPLIPVEVGSPLDCDLWWNEVIPGHDGRLFAAGHRVADVVALGATLQSAIARAYENIRRIRCLGSYYRTDVGQSLWPPGSE